MDRLDRLRKSQNRHTEKALTANITVLCIPKNNLENAELVKYMQIQYNIVCKSLKFADYIIFLEEIKKGVYQKF